jgi:hypothetical protein
MHDLGQIWFTVYADGIVFGPIIFGQLRVITPETALQHTAMIEVAHDHGTPPFVDAIQRSEFIRSDVRTDWHWVLPTIYITQEILMIIEIPKVIILISRTVGTHEQIAASWQTVCVAQLIESLLYPTGMIAFVVVEQQSDVVLSDPVLGSIRYQSKIITLKIMPRQCNRIPSANRSRFHLMRTELETKLL